MTRANVNIITRYGHTAKFEVGSDGYPHRIAPELVNLINSTVSTNRAFEEKPNGMGFYDPTGDKLATLIDELWLSLGNVGNFSFFYEVNFQKERLTIWDVKIRWQNAPENWEKKGYHCWKGKNGKYGYTNWVKGKRLFDKGFRELFDVKGEEASVKPEILEEIKNCDA